MKVHKLHLIVPRPHDFYKQSNRNFGKFVKLVFTAILKVAKNGLRELIKHGSVLRYTDFKSTLGLKESSRENSKTGCNAYSQNNKCCTNRTL